MTAAHLSALTDLKHHQVLWMDTLMTRSCVRVQRVKSLISPGNRGKKAFNNVPMRPLGCTEQYNWKHNRAAAISFTWTLLQYKINFWCPQDPLLILRCVIKPSEAYEYHDTAHWLASYWKMCTRCNTRDCTSGSADVNKLLCEKTPPVNNSWLWVATESRGIISETRSWLRCVQGPLCSTDRFCYRRNRRFHISAAARRHGPLGTLRERGKDVDEAADGDTFSLHVL